MLSLVPEAYSVSLVLPVSVIAILVAGVYILLAPQQDLLGPKAPPRVREGYPIIGALRFFTARWDFFQHARDHTPTGNFSFFLGKYPVVGLTGDKARKLFLESRELGLSEGYAVLFGQSPNNIKVDSTNVSDDSEFSGPGGYFSRRIIRMLKADNLTNGLPKILSDVRAAMEALAENPSGITDPFQSIYRIVYQLTMRTVACDDIADSPELIAQTLKLYETIDRSATPTAIMFPWFPSPAVIKRTIAGGRLYMIINKIVNKRKATGYRGQDPLQFLIDEGDSVPKIIEFIVGALFAGLLNSGINAAWILVYLAADPYWLSQCRSEVHSVLANHNANPSLSIIDQLAQLPIETWEQEFPIIDMCLRESIRIQALGTIFRKNISGRPIPTGNGDEVIPPNAFVTYALADLHLDPEVYKEPLKWDPARLLPDRAEDKKKAHGYIGWGAGRHPCLGMKFAKLENSIIIAHFIAMFDFELSDKNRKPKAEIPLVNFNKPSAVKPDTPVYIKYKLRK